MWREFGGVDLRELVRIFLYFIEHLLQAKGCSPARA